MDKSTVWARDFFEYGIQGTNGGFESREHLLKESRYFR